MTLTCAAKFTDLRREGRDDNLRQLQRDPRVAGGGCDGNDGLGGGVPAGGPQQARGVDAGLDRLLSHAGPRSYPIAS